VVVSCIGEKLVYPETNNNNKKQQTNKQNKTKQTNQKQQI
jgi:hypothetical protein